MKLLTLIRLYAGLTSTMRLQFVVLASLSGIANAAVLAIINEAAENVKSKQANIYFLVLFLIAIALYVYTQKHLMVDICRRFEAMVHQVRVRLVERARHAELLEIERIGRAEIYACVSRETHTIAQAAPTIVIAAQSSVLVLFTMFYLAWLSPVAFVLSAVFTTFGGWIHLQRSSEAKLQLQETYRRENDLVDRFSDLLDGFKEVKMDPARGTALAARIEVVSREVAELKIRTQMLFTNDFVMSQVTFFMLTGLMVFVVPNISPTYVDVVMMTTTASLFMIGPVSNVVGSLPIFASANSAAESVLTLDARLGELERAVAETPEPFRQFEQIRLSGLCFNYRSADSESGFAVGPIDLTIRRGQTIFLTGGNGSGKTTMVRTLIGLYPYTAGSLWLDRTLIDNSNLSAYRNLFSVVFSDNHLFRELYGIEHIDHVMADDLFELLEMRHKSAIKDHAFTNIGLSGGQRKRLALIAARLEKKPICMFDEWAADQDPYFRQKFYRVILPQLKAAGVTVIAITHDDAYFDTADVHLHMEYGRLRVIRDDSQGINVA